MSNKVKLNLIIVISVLAVIIIGLTLGLVFTAEDANKANNKLKVLYDVDDVTCTVELSGYNYHVYNTDENGNLFTDENGNVIEETSKTSLTLDDSIQSVTTKTLTFNKSTTTTQGSISFNDTTITSPKGYIEYIFKITNNSASSITQDLNINFSFTSVTSTNMYTKLSIQDSSDYFEFINSDNEADYSLVSNNSVPANTASVPTHTTTFILTFMADNPLYDASFDGTLNLHISYNLV